MSTKVPKRSRVRKEALGQPSIEYIEWVDSCSPNGAHSVWSSPESMACVVDAPVMCVSVGWVFSESKVSVGLASSVSPLGVLGSLQDLEGTSEVSGVIVIPKVAIVRRVAIPTP